MNQNSKTLPRLIPLDAFAHFQLLENETWYADIGTEIIFPPSPDEKTMKILICLAPERPASNANLYHLPAKAIACESAEHFRFCEMNQIILKEVVL